MIGANAAAATMIRSDVTSAGDTTPPASHLAGQPRARDTRRRGRASDTAGGRCVGSALDVPSSRSGYGQSRAACKLAGMIGGVSNTRSEHSPGQPGPTSLHPDTAIAAALVGLMLLAHDAPS